MAIHKSYGAVLTGDVVNSTKLPNDAWEKLIYELQSVLRQFLSDRQFEFYRGDSFQVYMPDAEKALKLALLCRCIARSLDGQSREEALVRSDIRISIGIGEINLPIKSLGLAKGEAFFLSGRQLEQLKEQDQRLAIVGGDPLADIAFAVMADYLDSIYREMTAKQADVIVSLFRGGTQQQLALTQKKSKSTISELASAGRLPEIEKVLKQYEKLVNLIL